MAEPSDNLESLANGDKSPSVNYAAYDTGVQVPLLCDRNGKRLPAPVPLVTVSSPASESTSNRPPQLTSRLPITSTPSFTPFAWPTVTDWKVSATTDLRTMSTTNTKATFPIRNDITPEIQSPLATSAVQAESIAKTSIEYEKYAVGFAQPSRPLVDDEGFIAGLCKHLAQDESFIKSVATQVYLHKDLSMRVALQSSDSLSTSAATSLYKLCYSRGLPNPILEVTSNSDLQGHCTFLATINVGRNISNVYSSPQCKSLEQAISCAVAEASQALKDQWGVENIDQEVQKEIVSTVTVNEVQKTDQIGVSHQKGNYDRNNPGRTPFRTRNILRTSNRSLSTTTGQVQNTSAPNLVPCTNAPYRGRSSSSLPVAECTVKALGTMNLSTQSKDSATCRKRTTHDADVVQGTTAQLCMGDLLARLSQVPASDGQARVVVICDYLGIDEPLLERESSQSESTLFVTHITNPAILKLSANSSTAASVWKQVENEIMQRLRYFGIERIADAIASRKRIRLNQRPIVINGGTGIDDDETEDEEEAGELFVDSNGDERLRLAQNEKL